MKTKSILIITVLTFVFCSVNAQFAFKGVGAGIGLGSKSAISDKGESAMGFGINVNALAGLTDKIDLAGGIVYYFPSEPVTGTKFSLFTISVDGHYKLTENFYGLAGLNIGMAKATATFMGYSASASDTKMGINLGAGANFDLSESLGFFGQVGYTVGGADQLFINAGLFYKLGK
jgi:outer membrane immunogenic protein